MEKIRSDTCFTAAFFLFPRRHTGLSERRGIFIDCSALAIMALILVLAIFEYLGELNLGGIGSGKS